MAGGGSSSQGMGTGQTMPQPTPAQYSGRGLGGFTNSIIQNSLGGMFGGMRATGTGPFQTQPFQQMPAPTYGMPVSQNMPGDIPPLVNQAYSNIFNRPADAAGAAYYGDQLANQGMTGQQLVSEFVGSPEFQRQQQYEQAYTQQFRPGPMGRPFNPNQAAASVAAPTTGPGGEALTTVDGKQGYYRQATGDEVRRSGGSTGGYGAAINAAYGINNQEVEGYDPRNSLPGSHSLRSRQVFVPYSPQAGGGGQNTQSQQFFQPIYLSRYQNYQPQGFQGPFGGQMNPYGGFNPFMGFNGIGGMPRVLPPRFGGPIGINPPNMYAYAKGGDVDTGIAGLLNG